MNKEVPSMNNALESLGINPQQLNNLCDESGLFKTNLYDKGRVKNIIHQIPIYAAKVSDLGERGARFMAYNQLKKIIGNSDQTRRTLSFTINYDSCALIMCGVTILSSLYWCQNKK